ncbi:MAG: DUF3592 domain-containing protein [Puniceicoccales bacterium]|nr:DUF3592 domain-containing protein [Puniceicoccales bacterium]
MSFFPPPVSPSRLRHKSLAPSADKKLPFLMRVVLVGFALISLTIAGFFIVVGGVMPIAAYVNSGSWETTPCEITESKVVEGKAIDGKEGSFKLEIRYAYTFQGETFTSAAINPKAYAQKTLTRAEAHTIAERYPKGKKLTCKVNQNSPEEACLERPSPTESLFVLGLIVSGTLLVSIAILVYALGIFPRKKKTDLAQPVSDNPFTAPPEKKRVASPLEKLLPFILGIVFFFAGSAIVVFFYIIPLRQQQQSMSWVETPCHVLKSEVKTHSGEKGSVTYSVYICYEYKWEEKKYIGEKYDFSIGSDNIAMGAKHEVVRQHPPGLKTVCFVNPDNPHEAVLARTMGDAVWIFPAMGGVFAIVGFLTFIFSIRMACKRNKTAVHTGAPVAYIDKPIAPLQQTHGNWVAFLFLAAFAIGWCYVMFGQIIPEMLSVFKEADGVDLIFKLSSFMLALMGIIPVLLALRLGLTSFVPKTIVEMKPVIRAGEMASLRWRICGKVNSVLWLKLKLCGEERFHRGQEEEKNAVEELELLNIRGPLTANSGELTFELPADVPLSGEYETRKIEWEVEAKLKLSFFPAKTTRFKITVA